MKIDLEGTHFDATLGVRGVVVIRGDRKWIVWFGVKDQMFLGSFYIHWLRQSLFFRMPVVKDFRVFSLRLGTMHLGLRELADHAGSCFTERIVLSVRLKKYAVLTLCRSLLRQVLQEVLR